MKTWARVTKSNRCPVCKHDTWCLYGSSIVCCMRVQSERPKPFKDGSVGWLHGVGDTYVMPVTKTEPARPVLNVSRLLREWTCLPVNGCMTRLAKGLGVSESSLHELQCTKTDREMAWAFPMVDGYGEYCGIRIRHENGGKWAVPGSQNGLFVPTRKPNTDTLMVVEGPTSCAAALTLGCYAIGRPSCSAGASMVETMVRRYRFRRVIIVADNDKPDRNGVCAGQRGAKALQDALTVPSFILMLVTKDIREFLAYGNKEMLDGLISMANWKQPKNETH